MEPREILVAEDTELWRTALEAALVEAGYRVRSCADGMDALRALLDRPPDVLIADFLLPAIDGGRLCSLVKARGELKQVATVILTGTVVPGIAREALADADAVIGKGRLAETLARCVEVTGDLLEPDRRDAYKQIFVEPSPLTPREVTDKILGLNEYQDTLHAGLADTLFEVDEDRKILRVNPSAVRLVERPEHELVGLEVDEVLGIEPGGALARTLEAALAGRGPPAPGPVEHGLGERRLESLVSGISRPSRRPTAIMLTRDVTERRRTEAALREAEQHLQHASKMEAIGRLAGGVAHDFNNLLTAIKGYVGLLLTDPDASEPMRADLLQVRKAADRAVELTGQLLTFARREELKPEVVDLNALVQDMEGTLRQTLGQDVELVTALSEGLGRVEIDPVQLERVILNLAANARDAMPGGGRLVVATSNVTQKKQAGSRHSWLVEPGDYVSLTIADTGSGIDEEHLTHIFEPFFTTKEAGRGTGIGLSIAYSVVKQLGGEIQVHSTPGQGTVFNIYLPRRAPAGP